MPLVSPVMMLLTLQTLALTVANSREAITKSQHVRAGETVQYESFTEEARKGYVDKKRQAVLQ